MEALIFELIVSIILTIVATYVLPYLKEKRILSYAMIIVEAVEQMIQESGVSNKKFEQAKTWLLEKFKLSDEEAKKIIESAVFRLKNKK